MCAADPYDRVLDPTGLFMPGSIPQTKAEWRRKRIAINFSFLWVLFPIVHLAGEHPPAWKVAVIAAGFLGFLAIYNLLPRSLATQLDTRKIWLTLAALGVIAIALNAVDGQQWAVLYVFAGIAGAIRLPAPWSLWWIAGSALVTVAMLVTAGAPSSSTISLGATVFAIGIMMFSFRRVIVLNQDLLAAREEVARLAVADERARFARDLHDLLGHSLSVIAVKAELAQRLIASDPQAAEQHVADLNAVARSALGEVREAVGGYRQPTLGTELSGAREALEAAGITAELTAPDVPLPGAVEAVLAWAVREGTTNTIRHSDAHHCRIVIAPGLREASAEVADDGPHPLSPNGHGHGLAGLRERVERVSGSVEAGPAPGGGFRLRVTVPMTAGLPAVASATS